MNILMLCKGKVSRYRMPHHIISSLNSLGCNADVVRVSDVGVNGLYDIINGYDILLMAKMGRKDRPIIKTEEMKKINTIIKIFYYMNDSIDNKREWVGKHASICSYSSGTCLYTCNKFKEYGCKNVNQIYQGYERDWFYTIGSDKINQSLFIGQLHDKNRKKKMQELREKKFNIVHLNKISAPETNKYFNEYKVNINFCTKKGFSNRCMRILGAGGFLLSQYDKDLEYSFKGGCVFWKTTDELIEKTNYYISHDKEREEIAKRGHDLIQNYTWEKQAEKILRAINGEIIIDGAFKA